MKWLCFNCFRWIDDTVCPYCLRNAPESAKEKIIENLNAGKSVRDRHIEWYRQKMTRRKDV